MPANVLTKTNKTINTTIPVYKLYAGIPCESHVTKTVFDEEGSTISGLIVT